MAAIYKLIIMKRSETVNCEIHNGIEAQKPSNYIFMDKEL